MRTSNSGTGRRFLAVTGAALAGVALAAAPLAPALAAEAPAQDLSITLQPDVNSQALGDAMLWGFTAKSNVEAGYKTTVELPAGLEAALNDKPANFTCSVSTNKRTVSCATTANVTGVQHFLLAVKGTKVGTYTATATIDGDAPDANPADNTATTTMTITARKSASVKGIVWDDANGNGRRDRGEKGVANAKVLFFIGGAMNPIATKYTDKGGHYSYTEDMTSGTSRYRRVLIGAPTSDRMFTHANTGSDDRDSDVSPAIGTDAQRKHFNGMAVAGADPFLVAGAHEVVDAGVVKKVKNGHIQGRIWNDVDKDGVMDAGEKGVAGVTVVLGDGTGKNGTSIHVTKTDSNGRYLFTNISMDYMGDPYQILVASPKGWKWAPNQHSNPAKPSDIPADVRKALGTDKNVRWAYVGPSQDDSNSMVAGLTKLTGDDDTLPTTGASVGGLTAGGGALLLGGAGALFLTRRRGLTA